MDLWYRLPGATICAHAFVPHCVLGTQTLFLLHPCIPVPGEEDSPGRYLICV